MKLKQNISKNFWSFLALDHGLTLGHINSVPISSLKPILENSKDLIDFSVLNYGLAKIIANNKSQLSYFVQCVGSPMGFTKFKVCNVEQAMSVGAKGISVQVNFSLSEDKLYCQLNDITQIVYDAHKNNLQVMFMVNQEINSEIDIQNVSRYCLELGADFIKLKCNFHLWNEFDVEKLKENMKYYPPILLAGGNLNDNIILEVQNAKDLGFSGYCIGRNIFQAKDYVKTINNLNKIWL